MDREGIPTCKGRALGRLQKRQEEASGAERGKQMREKVLETSEEAFRSSGR